VCISGRARDLILSLIVIGEQLQRMVDKESDTPLASIKKAPTKWSGLFILWASRDGSNPGFARAQGAYESASKVCISGRARELILPLIVIGE
jgi:hypothetical protein